MLLAAALVLPSLTGCATTSSVRQHRKQLQSVLDQGLLMLGESKVRVDRKPYRNDCSGFVSACYSRARLELVDPLIVTNSGTKSMFLTLKKRGHPTRRKKAKPGDLAFFHNTHDRNENGLRDDRFTHVALVEKVDDDGTVHYLHYLSGSVQRGMLNVKRRKSHRDPHSGKVWNTYLRQGAGKVLAGQLHFRFGRPLPPPGRR